MRSKTTITKASRLLRSRGSLFHSTTRAMANLHKRVSGFVNPALLKKASARYQDEKQLVKELGIANCHYERLANSSETDRSVYVTNAASALKFAYKLAVSAKNSSKFDTPFRLMKKSITMSLEEMLLLDDQLKEEKRLSVDTVHQCLNYFEGIREAGLHNIHTYFMRNKNVNKNQFIDIITEYGYRPSAVFQLVLRDYRFEQSSLEWRSGIDGRHNIKLEKVTFENFNSHISTPQVFYDRTLYQVIADDLLEQQVGTSPYEFSVDLIERYENLLEIVESISSHDVFWREDKESLHTHLLGELSYLYFKRSNNEKVLATEKDKSLFTSVCYGIKEYTMSHPSSDYKTVLKVADVTIDDLVLITDKLGFGARQTLELLRDGYHFDATAVKLLSPKTTEGSRVSGFKLRIST